MQLVVCLKQTFDTEEKLHYVDGTRSESGVKWVVNPYDEYAVEEAIRLKEKFGGEVTVVSVGPSRCETALRSALAMGADHAVRIDSEGLERVDETVVSRLLAASIRELEYDLVLCGYMAVDSGAGQGGPRLAEELNLPHAAAATKLTIEGEIARIERDVEGDVEIVEAKLPLVVTAQQGLNDPRYPPLPGIMKAKKKPLRRIDPSELGLDQEALKALTETVAEYPAPERSAGRRLDGSPEEQVRELARLLREEAKVI